MSLNNDELLLNIKRQAKRFSKSLSIPLGRAQENLSYVVYDCDSWGHLIISLKSKTLDNECLLLSALHPKADIILFKLLDNNMHNIINRFNVKFTEQKSNEEIKNIIINLFGIEPTDFESKIK
jgi:hypothetical protein